MKDDVMPKELPIPDPVIHSQRAIELVRVWAADGAQHVSIATELWKDPAAWGLVLVDLARHVAAAYSQNAGVDEKDALVRIREGFDAEWSEPSD
jgi:hypothetical protein